MRVCIVDDNALLRDALALVLRDKGHEVLVADSGADGVALAEREQLDCFVTDFNLPGMKGDTVAAAVRAKVPQLPIIIASGDAFNLTRGAADLFLAKPFTANDLLKACERAKLLRAGA